MTGGPGAYRVRFGETRDSAARAASQSQPAPGHRRKLEPSRLCCVFSEWLLQIFDGSAQRRHSSPAAAKCSIGHETRGGLAIVELSISVGMTPLVPSPRTWR